MKVNNILKGLGVMMMAGAMASCSSDYLQLEPESEISSTEIANSATGMKMVIYGLCGNTYMQYYNLYDFRWFNGEPWLSMVYGDVCGQDYNCLFWQSSSVTIPNWTAMPQDTYNAVFIPWVYCYTMINQANVVIDGGKDRELSGEMAFRVAQAYTFRAHAYTRLQQIYGPRWVDSNNGAVESVVLRESVVDPNGDVNEGLSTSAQVMDLIYSDLDKAIKLYEESGYNRGQNFWEPDINVAYGMYARAALLKDDWQTAKDMALKAVEGYPVMTAEEYADGFASPTSEWLWANASESAGIYFASFGATYACNGTYPAAWGNIGAGAIDYTFYQQVSNPNDVRCDLFFTPDKVSRAMRAKFWDPAQCDQTTMDVNIGEDLKPLLKEFIDERYAQTGAKHGWIYPFSTDFFAESAPHDITGQTVQFGAQFKFWSIDTYGSSSFPFMRSSEMYMIAAEASCHLDSDADAQDYLYDVLSNRITNYKKSTKTGADLLAEVKLQRRFELWGEGFSWFDFKRWNEPIVRNAWVSGDSRSGNWATVMLNNGQAEFPVDMNNGWRYAIPQAEKLYNNALYVK
jgi:hypothetical protein